MRERKEFLFADGGCDGCRGGDVVACGEGSRASGRELYLRIGIACSSRAERDDERARALQAEAVVVVVVVAGAARSCHW